MSSQPTPPIRVKLSRARGWRLPPNTVSVARPTKWGNPWKVGLVACGCRSAGDCNHNTFRAATAQEAVDLYRCWIAIGSRRRNELAELRDKNLACWCKPGAPCHADVLLELANR